MSAYFCACSFTCRTIVAKNCSCVGYLRVIALLFLILSLSSISEIVVDTLVRARIYFEVHVIAFLRVLERTSAHKDNGKRMNVRTKARNKESEEGNVL